MADADPARTLRRLAEVSQRPAITPIMAAFDIAGGLWLILIAIRAVVTRPALTEDATNYIIHAFGGLQAIVFAVVVLPLALALLLLAFGSLTQRAWAWYGNGAAIGLSALLVLGRFSVHRPLSVAAFAAIVWLAYAWLQPDVRRWYGTETTGA